MKYFKMKKMREEFEKWAADEGFDVSRNAFNRYMYASTHKAWQARQKEIDADKPIQKLDILEGAENK